MKLATLLLFVFPVVYHCASLTTTAAEPPYPSSHVIGSLTWHWETHRTAAPGSDLWPVTWGPDGHLYTAWGDGGGFGGTNSEGRVSMGFARIEGPPESFRGVNVNGGQNPEHPASFPKRGKTGGITAVDGTLYGWLNMQDGTWPSVNQQLIWSEDLGATWQTASWVFPKGRGNFKPTRFLNFGRANADVPDHLAGYVYFYGFQEGVTGGGQDAFLGRVPRTSLRDREAYEFFRGTTEDDHPAWTKNVTQAQPVFTDRNGLVLGGVAYHPALKRYLLGSYHTGPGQLGIFDGPEPWGPWTTVAYYEDWGKMGTDGHGLNCDFPQKWISDDGRTMWCVFSVYGAGAQTGIQAHDQFNVVKVSLTVKGK
jgi:hypothetical protein